MPISEANNAHQEKRKREMKGLFFQHDMKVIRSLFLHDFSDYIPSSKGKGHILKQDHHKKMAYNNWFLSVKPHLAQYICSYFYKQFL